MNSIRTLQEKINQSCDKFQKRDLGEESDSIFENFDTEHEVFKNTSGGNEVNLSCVIKIKDKQLRDQLDLIKILVVKLYNVNQGLAFLEERTSSVVRNIYNFDRYRILI